MGGLFKLARTLASGEIQWSKDVSRFHRRRPRGGRVKQFLRLACSFHALEIAFFLGGQSSDRQQRVPEVASDAANPGAYPSEFPGGQIHEDQIRPRERNGSEPELAGHWVQIRPDGRWEALMIRGGLETKR